MTITTTLNRIRSNSPCTEGWHKLLTHLGKSHADDEPLPYATILASNGLDDAIWCMRCEPTHAQTWRLFAGAFAAAGVFATARDRQAKLFMALVNH